jgi:hypothetical protein
MLKKVFGCARGSGGKARGQISKADQRRNAFLILVDVIGHRPTKQFKTNGSGVGTGVSYVSMIMRLQTFTCLREMIKCEETKTESFPLRSMRMNKVFLDNCKLPISPRAEIPIALVRLGLCAAGF